MNLYQFQQVKNLIQSAIEEDIGRGDVTTESTIAKESMSHAYLITKDEIVLAGMEIFSEVYRIIDNSVKINNHHNDGDFLKSKTLISELDGPTQSILIGERIALNFLQRLSGISTITRKYVDAVKNYNVSIVDTRKTTPGWRLLEKYAVRVGGGKNHRHDLGDGVLIKDNHIIGAGSIKRAVELARRKSHHLLKVEVEVETFDQIHEALDAGVDVIMLDNMPPEMLAEGVKKIDGRALVEASGGINLESIAQVARTGVNLISVGRLTHSAPSVDIHLEFDPSTRVSPTSAREPT
jgi:nicotinate-nucleotide pyrophosphorylase (carboxylating)